MMPKRVDSPQPALITELIALRPYIEHILVAGSYDGTYSRADVEDGVQLVLLKALGHLDAFRPERGGLKAWVACITRNVKVDLLRSTARIDDVFGSEIADRESTPAINSPERVARIRALSDKVVTAIDDMPAKLRDVLRYIDDDEVNHELIANELNISPAAAKMRLSRARAYLRDRFGSVDDHYAVTAPVPLFDESSSDRTSITSRTLTLFAQVVHLWPPFVFVLYNVVPIAPISASPADQPSVQNTVTLCRNASTTTLHSVAPKPPLVSKPVMRPSRTTQPRSSRNGMGTLEATLRAMPGDGRTVTNGD